MPEAALLFEAGEVAKASVGAFGVVAIQMRPGEAHGLSAFVRAAS